MNSRLQNLRKVLSEQNLDAVLISSLPNIVYLTNFSEFSTEDRDAFLLITKSQQYIFTHGIYKEAVEQQVKGFTLVDIKRENPISSAVKKLVGELTIKKLGFEDFDLKVNEYEKLAEQIGKHIVVPADLIGMLRVTKTPEEIQTIKKACALGDKAFSHILKKLKTGITEKELALELALFIRKQGAGISFSTIVAFGENASKPHHVPTDTKLQKNMLVLFDFGVKLDNYCSDMTRTVFFGKATGKQKKVYETVLTAQQKAIDTLKSLIVNPKSEITGSEVDDVAREYIISQGYPQMPHSLGHGIGLEVHEPPRLTLVSKEKLNEGMVFSIEPGIYLPGEFGVRIEDLFAIEKNKLVQLTNAPRSLQEI